jgi:phosphinothricin acetyltransferase
MASFHIREATEADLDAIDRIYHFYVLNSDCTMQTEPGSAQERRAWFAARGPLPVLVAEEAGKVIGWGALVKYHVREGYRFTLENSVYVEQGRHGGGIGRALLEQLLDRARALGAHSVVAKIVATQEPSLKLHTRLGFEEVGRLREVGFKFGRWIDVVFMQRQLTSSTP